METEINEVSNRAYKLSEIKSLINKLNFNIECDLYVNLDFNTENSKIILIQSDVNRMVGHYILIFKKLSKKKNRTFTYFFDPSATKPLELFSKYDLDQNYQNVDKMYEYLKNNTLTYNNFSFQDDKSKLCGIMCLVRYKFKELSNVQFKNYINKLMTIMKEQNYTNEITHDNVFIEIMNTLLKKI